ncbi:hypothetical protein LJC49_03065 [Ruminococcaceae bacterium OttesenSCG-928-I18]|nr:hypothetical protein [Ruminococcaceae bacterium OttesenSCG-928-I18]
MKYNLSEIMKKAHYLRTLGNNKSEALKKAWRLAKINIELDSMKFVDRFSVSERRRHDDLMGEMMLLNMMVWSPEAA